MAYPNESASSIIIVLPFLYFIMKCIKRDEIIKIKWNKTIYNLVDRYDGQLIQLEKIKKDENGYLIYSSIEDENKSYSVVWRIAYIFDEPKVLDVIIENSSYYVTKKSEFSQILRENKGDLSKLTEILEHVSFN